MPKSLKTREICLAAVQNDPEALDSVPKALKSECATATTNWYGYPFPGVFAIGKRRTTEPIHLFPIIWEEDPEGNLVVRNVFESKTRVFPINEYKKALKFSRANVFSSRETWKASKNFPLKFGDKTVFIKEGCLSLWGELSVS